MSGLLSSTVSYSVSQLIGRGSVIVCSAILAAKLETSQYAWFAYCIMTSALIANLTVGGLANKCIVEFSDRKSNAEGGLYIGVTLLSVFILVLVLFSDTSSFLDPGIHGSNLQLILMSLLLALTIIPLSMLQAAQDYKYILFISASGMVVLIAGAAISIYSKTVDWAIYGLMLSHLIAACVALYRSVYHYGAERVFGFNYKEKKLKSEIADMLPLVIVTMIAGSASWVLGRAMLSWQQGVLDFARFAISLQWFSLGMFLPTSISRVMLPIVVKNLRLNNASALRDTDDGSLISFASSIPPFFGVFIFSGYIDDFYGESYEGISREILIFMLSAIVASSVNSKGNIIIGSGRYSLWMMLTIIWFAILIGSFYMFLSMGLGSVGAAYSFFVSYLAHLVLTSLAIRLLDYKKRV